MSSESKVKRNQQIPMQVAMISSQQQSEAQLVSGKLVQLPSLRCGSSLADSLFVLSRSPGPSLTTNQPVGAPQPSPGLLRQKLMHCRGPATAAGKGGRGGGSGRGRGRNNGALKFHNFIANTTSPSASEHNRIATSPAHCLREEHGTKQITVSHWKRSSDQQPSSDEVGPSFSTTTATIVASAPGSACPLSTCGAAATAESAKATTTTSTVQIATPAPAAAGSTYSFSTTTSPCDLVRTPEAKMPDLSRAASSSSSSTGASSQQQQQQQLLLQQQQHQEQQQSILESLLARQSASTREEEDADDKIIELEKKAHKRKPLLIRRVLRAEPRQQQQQNKNKQIQDQAQSHQLVGLDQVEPLDLSTKRFKCEKRPLNGQGSAEKRFFVAPLEQQQQPQEQHPRTQVRAESACEGRKLPRVRNSGLSHSSAGVASVVGGRRTVQTPDPDPIQNLLKSVAESAAQAASIMASVSGNNGSTSGSGVMSSSSCSSSSYATGNGSSGSSHSLTGPSFAAHRQKMNSINSVLPPHHVSAYFGHQQKLKKQQQQSHQHRNAKITTVLQQVPQFSSFSSSSSSLPSSSQQGQPLLQSTSQHQQQQQQQQNLFSGSSNSSGSKKDKKANTQRSVIKQKLEDAFRQNGFLVKTKQVSDGDATFCKFRQLKKYSRYYLKAWHPHLPEAVNKLWKGFLPPKTAKATAQSAATNQQQHQQS